MKRLSNLFLALLAILSIVAVVCTMPIMGQGPIDDDGSEPCLGDASNDPACSTDEDGGGGGVNTTCFDCKFSVDTQTGAAEASCKNGGTRGSSCQVTTGTGGQISCSTSGSC